MFSSNRDLLNERNALLKEIEERFAVILLSGNKVNYEYRDDVTKHVFFPQDDREPGESTKQEIRRFAESRSWQFSR